MQRLHRAGFPRVEVSEQPPSCGADAVVSPVAFELAEAGEQPPMTNGSSAVALAQGNCLWTVVCGSDHSRWALDYRYGNFPFQEGQRCLFEGSEYRIESVGTSLLRVALVAEQAPVYDVSLD